MLRLRLDMAVPMAEYDEAERIVGELGGSMAATPRVGVLVVDRAALRLTAASPVAFGTELLPVLLSAAKPPPGPRRERAGACRAGHASPVPAGSTDGLTATMWIKRLEVTDWAGIADAAIDLEPGLNVLHGPNALGKSSLVNAIRAALLLQSTSAAAAPLRDWHADAPPQVTLTFEQEAQRVWRVRKSFGSSGHAYLEFSRDGCASASRTARAHAPCVRGPQALLRLSDLSVA